MFTGKRHKHWNKNSVGLKIEIFKGTTEDKWNTKFLINAFL